MGRTYAYDLVLNYSKGSVNVSQLNPKGFNNLKSLHIEHSNDMEYVVNVEEQVEDTMFVNLEILDLYGVRELKAIWNRPLVERPFEKLRVLKIHKAVCSAVSVVDKAANTRTDPNRKLPEIRKGV
ncbi:hypothetical protein GIB67_004106 [Kingdonia uniflora]|uniref:Uncharacterized protein n=1 Tax=Kingdonia uniflora TaxID=39325 RepID=A0A7J7NRW4_9MAGN|nr:hypothetical protein GIB67_004106 [Kingdonia uniflora]